MGRRGTNKFTKLTEVQKQRKDQRKAEAKEKERIDKYREGRTRLENFKDNEIKKLMDFEKECSKELGNQWANGYGKSRHDAKEEHREINKKNKQEGKPWERFNSKDSIHSSGSLKAFEQSQRYWCEYLVKNCPDLKSVHEATKEDIQKYAVHMIAQPKTKKELQDVMQEDGTFKKKKVDVLVRDENEKVVPRFKNRTINTYLGAPLKVYKLTAEEAGVNFMEKKREDITNNRQLSNYTLKHFSFNNPANKELWIFTCATGPRGDKELSEIRKEDLLKMDGKYYINIKEGKNGKPRLAPVLTVSDRQLSVVLGAFERTDPGEKVFPHVHNAAPVHFARNIYNSRAYFMFSREPDQIPEEDRYYLASELKGYYMDRVGMGLTSAFLGHSREEIQASAYSAIVCRILERKYGKMC